MIGSVRLPLVWVDVQEREGVAGLPRPRVLLLGPAASGLSLPITRCLSLADAVSRWGARSPLAHMVGVALDRYPMGEVYAASLTAPQSSSAASWALAITGTATASGTLRLWVGDRRYSVAVASGDTAATVATAVAAAVTADTSSLVTATAQSGTVTLTSAVAGAWADALRVAWDEGTLVPGGMTLAEPALTAGAGDWTLPSLGAERWDAIAVASDAISSALGSALDTRWTWQVGLLGHGYACTRGEASAIVSEATSARRQYRHLTRCVIEPGCRASPWDVAAAVAAIAARESEAVPGPNLDGAPLSLAGTYRQTWSAVELDALLQVGVSPVAGADLQIVRLTTTRYCAPDGTPDLRSYDLGTMLALAYTVQSLRQTLAAYLTGRRVATDSPSLPPGVVSPSTVRDLVISWVGRMEAAGALEYRPELIRQIQVTRNEYDPARLDVYLPVDMVDGLHVLAVGLGY